MAKRPDIEALTANNLRDGEVVFYTGKEWSAQVNDAQLARTPQEAENLMEVGVKAEEDNQVVGAYLVGVSEVKGEIKADHIRERIRTLGPTIRVDLGKQAEGSSGSFPALDGTET